MCAQTEKTTFSGKDDIFRQRQLYIDKSHTVLDIFRSRGHNIDMNFGMSVGVAWFPDYGHIVAGIFSMSLIGWFRQLFRHPTYPAKCLWLQ